MKQFTLFLLLVTSVFCAYLDGLNRSFEEIDGKIVDFYVTMTPQEVNNLIQLAQISSNQVSNGNSATLEDFETKSATVVVKYNGNENTYENVSFKTGGMYNRSNSKVGYNLKFDKKLFGRKQLRLRPEPGDRTYMRSKLCCDIANRIGLPSIQGGYGRLYMNNEYWGLYTIMDAVKTSWIKANYDVTAEEVTTLYQCKTDGMNFKNNSYQKCTNANDDFPDMNEFKIFAEQVNAAKTVEDLEKIMDVDVFLKYMAFEWLIGSFDHFLVLGHNFYFYKRESDNKWVMIEYDYDNTFGNGLSFPMYWTSKNLMFFDIIKASFATWELNHDIIKILVHNDNTRFKKIVREVLVAGFNPTDLDNHINQLKSFLTPYVKEDLTPNADNTLPGRINKKGTPGIKDFSEFEKNIESTVNNIKGVKEWISGKFDTAISEYSFNNNEILNEAKSYIAKPYDFDKSSSSSSTTTTTSPSQPTSDSCWASSQGYQCCSGCDVYYTDENGSWGIENNQWCGILSNCDGSGATSLCHSEGSEYPCCNGCDVYYTDNEGKWGVENGNWCGIKYSC